MQKLNEKEIEERMKEINSTWMIENDFISKEFLFKDFVQAFAFMTAVAAIAEKQQHHPNWENVYNKVHISLSTHNAGGVTEKDFQLAKEVDTVINHLTL